MMKKFKKLTREDLKTLKGGEKQVFFAETTCGIQATTTQDWTPQQHIEWLEKLEAYYCKPAVHQGSSTNLA